MKAERSGIHLGQPLAEAKSLLPRAIFLPSNAEEDRKALIQLAIECQCFSPLVGLEQRADPECLVSEVAGCTHLWKGEEQFLRAVRDYWIGRGYSLQVALAGSIGAAWALAHSAPVTLVPSGNEEQALSHLPVAALRLESSVLDRLSALGLDTIGEVIRLPRDSLAARFGVELPRRLDQVMGLLPETLQCERLKEPLRVCQEWDEPVEDRFAVGLVSRQLLNELLVMAGRHGMGLQELEGNIRTESGLVKIDIKMVEPTCDDRHLAQLVELQLERKTWQGGVVAVAWAAMRLALVEQNQGRWFDQELHSKGSRAFNALVERLSSRLEARSVLRVELVAEAQPEHAVRLVPWTSDPSPTREAFLLEEEQSRGRPFRLLNRPAPIEVISMVPGGSPERIVWNRHPFSVVRSWGPERIETGWWRVQDIERDYYRVEWEDGTHAWVYRDRRLGRWFLHGFFD